MLFCQIMDAETYQGGKIKVLSFQSQLRNFSYHTSYQWITHFDIQSLDQYSSRSEFFLALALNVGHFKSGINWFGRNAAKFV